MKAVPDQVARFVPQPFVSLGTDGYGFSDTREALRRHFEGRRRAHRRRYVELARAAGRCEGRGGGRSHPALRDRRRGDRPPARLGRLSSPGGPRRRRCAARRSRAGRRRPNRRRARRHRRPSPCPRRRCLPRRRPASRCFGEQVVVETLLELAGLAEPAGTSFSGHLVTYLAGADTGGPGRRVKCPGTGVGRPRQGSWTHHDAAEICRSCAQSARALLRTRRDAPRSSRGRQVPRRPEGRAASRSRSSRSPEVGAPLSVAICSLWVVLPFFPQCVTERTRRTYLDRKTKSRTEARAIGVIEMKRMIVSLVAAAALAAPVGWASTAGAKSGPDPDANGDVHSNCHTGSKFRGAGGEDAWSWQSKGHQR